MAVIYIKSTPVMVDECDLELVAQHSWFLNPQGCACTKIKRTDGSLRTIGMHRIILGDPIAPAIDHINRNKLDNRRENIIPCSDSWSNRNKPKYKNKKSQFRGVSFNRGKWNVVIRLNGKLKWMGAFETELEAAKVAGPHFDGIPE
jgi:hypothetical protein